MCCMCCIGLGGLADSHPYEFFSLATHRALRRLGVAACFGPVAEIVSACYPTIR